MEIPTRLRLKLNSASSEKWACIYDNNKENPPARLLLDISFFVLSSETLPRSEFGDVDLSASDGCLISDGCLRRF